MLTVDLTTVAFKDTAFLQQVLQSNKFGLNEFNVLDYFSQSQFYEPSCIREQLKMQSRFNELQTGIDFELWYFTHQPLYFVIRKIQRYSPTKTIYYIIEGTIYQAPSLGQVLTNRLKTVSFHISKAIRSAQNSSRFHPRLGYYWESDESAIKKAYAKRLEEQAQDRKPPLFEEQRISMDFRNRVDQLLVSTFSEETKRTFVGTSQPLKRIKPE